MFFRFFSIVLCLFAASIVYAQTPERKLAGDSADRQQKFSTLGEVMVTANRNGVKRSEAPVAIASLSAARIEETKAVSIDQLLNKVSGINMVSLGNEQHQMSIRQPISVKSLFLYLQDGIPIRTSGLFNHNALLEINMAMVKSIEVVKGPSSASYGSEAIGGVVNFITRQPSDTLALKVSVQGNDIGYKRTDIFNSFTIGKLGMAIGGYFADKRGGVLEYTDFQKGAITMRTDYRISSFTSISQQLNMINYYSDMPGGIDSAMFAKKIFRNLHSFTYRKVRSVRYHSTLTRNWTNHGVSMLTLIYRDNRIEQNPAYRVADDYRRRNGEWGGRKDLAHGEINKNSFNSYAFVAQHRQSFEWRALEWISGVSIDASPSQYSARYIQINKDSNTQKYTGYRSTDSTLSDYGVSINNYAAYMNLKFSPVPRLNIVASMRYDLFRYHFVNRLLYQSSGKSRDTLNYFRKTSGRIGATYNFTNRTGLYLNYSEGFIPPQVTEIYTSAVIPDLKPSSARNYEIGGWMEIIRGKLMADLSLYYLSSTNQVVSVRLESGAHANRNAGKTSHKGIETSLTAKPLKNVLFRFGGSYNEHTFVNFIENGMDYSGKFMNGAPKYMFNAEVSFSPSFIKGLRTEAEVRRVGKYFMDAGNTAVYPGYTIINFRAGYKYEFVDLWVNLMNVTNKFYATVASKSAYGYSYTLADPFNINIGVAYHLGHLFNHGKR